MQRSTPLHPCQSIEEDCELAGDLRSTYGNLHLRDSGVQESWGETAGLWLFLFLLEGADGIEAIKSGEEGEKERPGRKQTNRETQTEIQAPLTQLYAREALGGYTTYPPTIVP